MAAFISLSLAMLAADASGQSGGYGGGYGGGGYGGGYGNESAGRGGYGYSAPPNVAAPRPTPAPPRPTAAAPRRGNPPPAGERRYVRDEVLIEVAGRPTESQVAALAGRFRLDRIESRTMDATNSTYFRWRIPDRRTVSEVIRAIEADHVGNPIVSVQPNYGYELNQAPPSGDPAQYALAKLRLPEAHSIATGDKVLVAVIDSVIDVSHPELNSVIEATFDAVRGEGGESDPHGTGIAGVIAAHARLMGAAPAVRILGARAFNGSGGSSFSIINALDWALGKGARIVNMSFVGPPDPALARVIAVARQKGAVLIAAVGNAGLRSPALFPASDPNVIAVTATDADDRLFAQANRGRHIAVAAPGVDILVPAPGASYRMSTGTSFAAAYVSGIAALLLERRPDLSPDAIRTALIASARDLGRRGRDQDFGAGLVDAVRALEAIEPSPGAIAVGAGR